MRHIEIIRADGKRFGAMMAEKGDEKVDACGRRHPLQEGEVFFNNYVTGVTFGKIEGNKIVVTNPLSAMNVISVIAPDRADLAAKYSDAIDKNKVIRMELNYEFLK